MDASEKWMIIWFTPQPTTTFPNGCSFEMFSLNHPWGKLASAAVKYIPQTGATTFAFSSVYFFYAHTRSPNNHMEEIFSSNHFFDKIHTLLQCKKFKLETK